MTDISIVIVNWNQSAATRERALHCAAFDSLRPTVWVVDNGSDDQGVALGEAAARVRVIRSETNLGYGGGNNLALRHLESEFVLLLNNDAALAEDDLARLTTTMAADDEIAVLGPVVVDPRERRRVLSAGGRDIARHVRTHVLPKDLPPGRLELDEPLAVDYVPGSVVLLRTATLRRAGLLDEAYFFGGELADFCCRARALGHSVLVLPSARAWHDIDQSSELRSALYPYYILRNRFLFIRRHRRRALLPLFVLWLAWGLAAVARDLVRGDRRRARLLTLALADGLRGRFGGRNELVRG